MGGKESDQWRLDVEAESIVVEVYGVQLREVEDGGEEGGKRLGDLAQETGGENVGKVGNLRISGQHSDA